MTEKEESGEPFDVFLWANEIDEVKNNVSAELFLFNKNYTPYKIKYSDKLTGAVKSMFMQEAIHYILEEADKGLECREYERSDGEEKVIYRTKLSKVGRAETLIHLIENEYKDIDYFSESIRQRDISSNEGKKSTFFPSSKETFPHYLLGSRKHYRISSFV